MPLHLAMVTLSSGVLTLQCPLAQEPSPCRVPGLRSPHPAGSLGSGALTLQGLWAQKSSPCSVWIALHLAMVTLSSGALTPQCPKV